MASKIHEQKTENMGLAWLVTLTAALFFFYEFIQLNLFNAIAIATRIPNAASNRTALRHPIIPLKIAKGVCATSPPNIAIVTTKPVTNAILLGGNQREAKRIQLKKQKDAPMPTRKRPAAATK